MNKIEVLHALNVITHSKDMEMKLRESIGSGMLLSLLQSSIENDICVSQICDLILQIAPTCYEINGKIFLKGNVQGQHDFVGDGQSSQKATELFNMTQEMETGDSYSFYVSDTSYFILANPEGTIKVNKFLTNLRMS